MCWALLFVALAGQVGDAETGQLDEARRLSMLGRTGEAEKMVRGLKGPIARAMRALIISRDTRQSREEGVRDFDPALARKLATSAVPELKARAAADPACAAVLGSLSFFGLGMPASESDAFRWWTAAAQRGNPSAMHQLALCYRDGTGTQRDPNQAFQWAKRSAEAGNPHGLVILGEFHAEGIGTAADPAKATACYERAAKGGQVDAMLRCSDAAVDRMRKANRSGDFRAVTRYRMAYDRWNNAAATAGNAEGHFRVAIGLQNGAGLQVLPGVRGSFREFKLAAESGIPSMMLNLACCYYEGWGCPVDTRKGETLLLDALEGAKRDKDDKLLADIEAVLAEKGADARAAALRELVDWPDP